MFNLYMYMLKSASYEDMQRKFCIFIFQLKHIFFQ